MFAAPPPCKLAPVPNFRFALPLFSALLVAFIIALWPLAVYAGDITVDGSTCTLPDAIAAANTNTTVGGCSIIGTPGTETLLLTAATYSVAFNASYNVDALNATPSVSTTIVISSGVEGGSIVQREAGSNARLFHIAAAGDLTLRGITVTNGKLGTTAANADYGAGIFNRGKVTLIDSKLLANASHRGAGLYNTGTARLTNVEVYNNIATQHGGGIYNNNSSKTVTMTNTQVISNSAVSNGGGIYNNTTNSRVTITNSQIISNSAVNGAGILNSTDSTVAVTNSWLRGNTATGSGGALQNNSGTVTILNTEVARNTATSDGAGLYNNITGTLTVTSTQVVTNIAGRNGGGIFNGKTVKVVDSNVSGNTASSDGGGLYNTAGTSTILNTSFVGNHAQTGGAISSNQSNTKVLLNASEIIQNSANGDGGGVYINSNGSSAAITSTLILSNSAGGKGGGVAVQPSSSATMTDTQIRGNHANSDGGGIFGNTSVTINLTNGELVLNTSNGDGGALNIDYRATVINSDIISNTANREGGGIYNGFNSQLILTDSDVIGNRGTNGGGIYNGKKATITNGDFLSNTASSGSGGGIYSAFIDLLTVTNSDVVGNRANGDGGGIRSDDTATLTNVNLRYNRAGGRGGGLFTPYAGGFTLTGEVVGNTAGGGGGGIFSQATSSITLSGTMFISNTALGGNGGALYAYFAANLTNSPIRNNRASGNGGGIYSEFNSVNLTNSDVISNAAGASGGGIHSFYSTTLNNSDLISNTAVGDGGGVYGTTGVNIVNASVYSNTAGGDGGAFFSQSGASLTNAPLSFNRAAGIGGGFYAFSTASVTNSDLISNYSGSDGGGIYANNNVSLDNSDLLSNTAEGSGGGLYSDLEATLTNSNVAGNHAGGRGGGIYNSGNNTLGVTNSDFTANSADGDGGGLFINVNSTATVGDSDFLTNTTLARGGGIFANTGSNVTVTNSEIRANTSITNGGGFFNNATATLTNVQVNSNTTAGRGGGIHNTDNSHITLTSADLIGNHADGDGGGFYTSNTAIFSDMQILSNTATANGGGLYNDGGAITVTLSNLSGNQAGASGGATQQFSGSTTINQSCIVNNTDTAVDRLGGNPVVAANNWWGSPDGPGGVAIGSGDSVTNSVTFAPFETSAILGCPTRTTDFTFAKSVAPAGDLLPGQPLTFTLVITNNAPTSIYNLRLVDVAPAEFIFNETATSGTILTPNAGGYHLSSVQGDDVATVYLRGVVTRTLSADTVLTNTATISNILSSLQSASTSFKVKVPLVRWSQASYSAGEGSGIFSATITISPTNPYTLTTAQAHVPSPTIANITFTPGSSSQPVGVVIPNDALVFTRTIPLNLFAAIGAVIDAAGDDAIVVTTEDDDVPAITIEKSANVTEAWVGDTITYTYRITNTGNVTLTTIAATDDILGAVVGLAGQLIPGGTRSATLAYTVQGADWPGPLVNSVTVTGTDIFAAEVNDNDSVSVVLTTPNVAMSKQANPAGNLLPGQPLTYTITISNEDVRAIPNLTITDTLPSGFSVSNVITTGPSISLSGGNYVIAQLPAAQVATIAFVGAVDANLTDDLVLENKATLTQALTGVLTATTSNHVVLPLVTWSTATYAAVENDGTFTATLLLSPVNPFAAVSVGVVITDSSPVTQAITFPANSGSQAVVVSFTNDGLVLGRTIYLQSQSPTNAKLGGGVSGPLAEITLLESDAAPAIMVAKSANLTQAWVGETVTYTYRITNTGNVTLTTVDASDDQLGAVAGLAGQLNPGETRSATLSYVVQQGDLPGPLVNTVTVTGTDLFITEVHDDASASVSILEALPAITVEKSAQVTQAWPGDTITYTVRITNTGNVTLTTIDASDDKLGAVADLAGQLNPGETRSATLTYVVQSSDLPGPLVNTVTVTGTDRFANQVSEDARVSVAFDTPSVAFVKYVDQPGDLLPGQPLIYTLVVTNEEDRAINDLFVTDELPTGFVLGQVNTTGTAISFNGFSYVIEQLPALGVATIEFTGAVDESLTANLALDNTATLTNSLIGQLSASTHNDVVVPTVTWSDASYETDESSGTFTATLLLSPANPYASVSVNVSITESPTAAVQSASSQAQAVQVITFPPNSTSQPVVVSFANDGVVVARTITLQLQSLSGVALGGGASGSLAAIEIIEDNAAPALVLTASVNTAQAFVGDTITYTVRITNTGNVTFTTIAAMDDILGGVAGLAGQLLPGETRTAIQSYTVQPSDLPGPLVNTVTVTGTDIFNTNVAQSTVTSVNVSDPTALPETDQPQQPQWQLYLPSLEVVKD